MFRSDAYEQSRTHFAQDRLRSYFHGNAAFVTGKDQDKGVIVSLL